MGVLRYDIYSRYRIWYMSLSILLHFIYFTISFEGGIPPLDLFVRLFFIICALLLRTTYYYYMAPASLFFFYVFITI